MLYGHLTMITNLDAVRKITEVKNKLSWLVEEGIGASYKHTELAEALTLVRELYVEICIKAQEETPQA